MSLAVAKLAELVLAAGGAPLNKHEGCWEHQLDEHWWIAWNGHREDRSCSRAASVPPFHCFVEYNGWPAGLIQPYGGIIAAGAAANENTFIAAIEAALSKLKQGSSTVECRAHNPEAACSTHAPASIPGDWRCLECGEIWGAGTGTCANCDTPRHLQPD